MPQHSMAQRIGAEFIGTFWLVFGGCGSAVLAAAFPELGIGFAGVSLAFGQTVLTATYTLNSENLSFIKVTGAKADKSRISFTWEISKGI